MGDLKVYTLEQAAKLLQTSPRTLRGYLNCGKLKGAKMGVSWRILEDNLIKFLEGGAEVIEANRSPEHRGTELKPRGYKLSHETNNGGGRKKKQPASSVQSE